ncbi:MAG TPA: putative quinol monooxygenase [Methylococcaceae bacterium]|nr:putative quinol monooxygenase [Methylococcaceae bacterium]
MASESVRVVARITAQPAKVEELAVILRDLMAETRQEKGCIHYQLLQNKSDPCDFTFVEEWMDDSAIDAHLVTPHVRAAFSKATPLLATNPDIRRYRVVG